MVVGLCLLGMANAVLAQSTSTSEDDDLKRIPPAAEATPSPGSPTTQRSSEQRIRIEDAFTGWDNQTPVIPTPAAQPSWQNRLSLDADIKLPLANAWTFGFSDRLNVFAGSLLSAVSRANAQNDLREIYLSDELVPRTYIEAGRVNLKEGIAYGYNPTDFFKTRSAVQLSSIDPSAARESRLGVVMIKAQRLFDGGSVTAAYAPRLTDTAPIPTSALASFDPGWGRTNADGRGLLSVSWNGSAFNPQLLAFHDAIGTHWGGSLSRVLNAGTVAYLEWSGVREPSLTARALAFGERTGALPAGLSVIEHVSGRKPFSNDLSIGASWTSAFNLTLNVEYHYHESGLSGPEFSRISEQGANNTRSASQFWYVRQYAADQQEPLTRREFFLRADWQDVIPSTLNLGAIAFVAENDGSGLAQMYAQYFPSRNWTISAYVGTTIGSKTSAFGSLPWRVSGVVQVVRYL
ncbi:hypothetical protein [Rhodanobacter sp. OK091]|uniref:hypothetical protein n=1 Tax=Rhodanobacter sp. OK091 TaxID=1881037 RepID=UPI00090F07C9|nr:hypothetical protein [Rhodanobacter sp. OK091]SHL74652.1 hypothetical protein SAMN05428972_1016 [Rhodanobacter sp. OK091]